MKPAGQGAGTTYGVPGAMPWEGLWSQCLRGKSPLKAKFKGSAESACPIECTATRWQPRLQADGGEQPFPASCRPDGVTVFADPRTFRPERA